MCEKFLSARTDLGNTKKNIIKIIRDKYVTTAIFCLTIECFRLLRHRNEIQYGRKQLPIFYLFTTI